MYNNIITISNKASTSGVLHRKKKRFEIKRYFASISPQSFFMFTSFSGKGSFTNYVDKKKWVGSPKC